ncbi:hypothetical protein TrLO_g7293 [Triparma laevis f. longispina]|nr:hypothetical protein TrLO_g7293 [Triparma laevis f. longispina]
MCNNKIVKPKNINLPSIPYNAPTVNTSMYPPTSTENNQNLREYRCTRCGQPKKGHVCTADPDAPETWTQWKPTPVPKQQVYTVNYIQAVIQELEPPPPGELEIWTSRLYKDEEEGSWGGEFRVCHYEKEGVRKVGVRVEESWMEFQFASLWKNGGSEGKRNFRLWKGDVIVGIGGKGVETFFGMEDRTLENMEEEWKGNFVDLTVMRGTKSVTPKHFVVNPIYGIPFYDCDSSDEEVEDKSEGVVITAIEDAREWLKNRKDKWRGWRGIGANYQHGDVVGSRFWEEEEKGSFEEWYEVVKEDWENNYSWNRKTRKALIAKYDKGGVTLSKDGLEQWLAVRKIGWQVERIKRKKKRKLEEPTVGTSTASLLHEMTSLTHVSNPILKDIVNFSTELNRGPITKHVYSLDWIFDVARNGNDDVVYYFMSYLSQFELMKLCMLSRSTREQIEERENIWKMKCKSHRRWNLPSRPRKGWFDLYFTKYKTSTLLTRRNSDALLLRFSQLLDKGDALSQVQKLVKQSEADWDFGINYTSGSVLDRNGLLNYAVIKQRKNVVKWLVDGKNAWIETSDAGGFTPLLNAVYNNDLYFVRYFLSRGSNRNAIGITHSSQGFKANFEGLKAEGWARKKGFEEVANEIKYGVSKFVR